MENGGAPCILDSLSIKGISRTKKERKESEVMEEIISYTYVCNLEIQSTQSPKTTKSYVSRYLCLHQVKWNNCNTHYPCCTLAFLFKERL